MVGFWYITQDIYIHEASHEKYSKWIDQPILIDLIY